MQINRYTNVIVVGGCQSILSRGQKRFPAACCPNYINEYKKTKLLHAKTGRPLFN